jgi:hypothetical protein
LHYTIDNHLKKENEMQIFVTDPCPKRSAQRLWKDPVRGRKMLTETQQILACACSQLTIYVDLRKSNGEKYKTPKSRINHPVIKWASQSRVHVSWLIDHLYELYRLYQCDGGGAFLNVNDNLLKLYEVRASYDPHKIQFLNFAKADAKGLDFTEDTNVFRAYDNFLRAQGA